MHTFYLPNWEQIKVLSEAESKHAVKVLRLKTGDKIRGIDGKGNELIATISNPHQKRCEFVIDEVISHEKPTKTISIAIAPTKSNDRIEWFLEKAVEIGITEFTPLICTHSERKKFNEQRWEKVVISAMKQSQRVWLPTIHSPKKYSVFVKQEHKAEVKAIAYCGEEFPKKAFASLTDTTKNQLILIGPEGDFSPEETQEAVQQGFAVATLGTNRLRTETAGIVACTLMKFA